MNIVWILIPNQALFGWASNIRPRSNEMEKKREMRIRIRNKNGCTEWILNDSKLNVDLEKKLGTLNKVACVDRISLDMEWFRCEMI